MYRIRINDKAVQITLEKEAGIPRFKSVCDGRKFYSCIAKRDGMFCLLLDRSIVGVGLWTEDQELLAQMSEDYKEMKGGRSNGESDSES